MLSMLEEACYEEELIGKVIILLTSAECTICALWFWSFTRYTQENYFHFVAMISLTTSDDF